MKNKIIPTDQELKLDKDTFIVSRANEQGKIVYANQEFIDISGYSEDDVIGNDHNFIRHPDMPKAIFKLLWDTIKSGHEFNGYIKNLCKNGSYYWVFATIAQSMTASDTIYYSVRKKPTEKALNAVIPLYNAMLDAEKKNPNDHSLTESSNILFDEFLPFNFTYDQYVLSL